MKWTLSGQATLAGLLLLGGLHAHAVGTLYAGFGGPSDGVSVRSATTLTETGSFATGAEPSGIAAGLSSSLYLASGDTVSSVNLEGTVLSSSTVTGAGFTDVALLEADLWVTAAGTADGLSRRDPTSLAELEFVDTAFEPTSIEDGFGRLYVTAGETIYIFLDGVENDSAGSGTAGVIFVDSALSGTRLYAVTGGTQNGVSVRNPITLDEIASFSLSFAVDGIVTGDDDDLFLTSGASIYRYSTAGVELDFIADGTAGRTFSDIAFVADPLPPASGTALAITANAAGNTISKIDAETLADAGDFSIAVAASGIALGPQSDLYLAAGDTLYNYGTGGILLGEVTEQGEVFTDVAVVDGDLIASLTDGFSVRDAASPFAETSRISELGFTPSAISAGATGEVYMTAGNVVYRYTTAGTQLAMYSGNAGFTYTDVALVKSVVYATYNSATGNGVSVLDPGSLSQSDVINTPIAANGIAAGGGNDYYISGDNSIYHYALDEVLSSFTAPAGTSYPDVAYTTEGSNELTTVVAAILPSSRSVQVGDSASAFATLINTGSVTASKCRIEPATTVPGTFSYQTTDGGTNELVGAQDTPADIAAGSGRQSFVFAFVPSAPFAAAEVSLDFKCSNAEAAPVFVGLNTLLLSADADPVPDVIALVATPDPLTPGIVNIPGVDGTGFFSLASVNVGVAGDLSVTATMTDGDPNVVLSLCETNPLTGACINPLLPTTGPVNLTIGANSTPTFSIFAAASGEVALDAAGKRIRVLFADQVGDAPRGAASVAVRTQ